MFKVVFCVSGDDVSRLKKNYKEYLSLISGADGLVAITPPQYLKEFESVPDIKAIDENTVIPNWNFQKIKSLLESVNKDSGHRTGWYFQQFLKLGYSFLCNEEYYLCFDADTIPLKKIDMFENGKPVLDLKSEYNRLYFNTIGKLFSGAVGKEIQQSFISEHMLFKTNIVKEMLLKIGGGSGNLSLRLCMLSDLMI